MAYSQLLFLRARYYDPATGRFLTRDPFPGFTFDPISQQPYVYARSNPVNLVDPSGLQRGGPEWFRELVELCVKLSGVTPETGGIGIGAGVGAAFVTLGVVGAPVVIGAIVVRASAGIIMDQLINPRYVFPGLGLAPPQ